MILFFKLKCYNKTNFINPELNNSLPTEIRREYICLLHVMKGQTYFPEDWKTFIDQRLVPDIKTKELLHIICLIFLTKSQVVVKINDSEGLCFYHFFGDFGG